MEGEGGSTPRTLIPVWTLPLRHISSSLGVANGVEWGWKKCTDPMVGGARSITLYDACTPSSACKYKDAIYHKCGKAGHITPVCKSAVRQADKEGQPPKNLALTWCKELHPSHLFLLIWRYQDIQLPLNLLPSCQKRCLNGHFLIIVLIDLN